MAPEPAPRKSGGMSLYANLLDPSAESTPGTISRAPVVFKQSSETDANPEESAAKKPQIDPGTFPSPGLTMFTLTTKQVFSNDC